MWLFSMCAQEGWIRLLEVEVCDSLCGVDPLPHHTRLTFYHPSLYHMQSICHVSGTKRLSQHSNINMCA